MDSEHDHEPISTTNQSSYIVCMHCYQGIEFERGEWVEV